MSIENDQIWIVVVGFIIAFILAFGIGANDVANSFGTSVGSKVLTLRQACILASMFETLGAVLLGAKVSDTIRKGIIDVEPYTNNTELLMVGNLAALSGSCCWLLAATLLRLPVSATHSIVGATVGFALVAHGARGIHWQKLALIIGSWFISPIAAGIVSTLIFLFCRYFILKKTDPLEPGLKFLPVFYASVIIINFFSIFYDGPELFYFDRIPIWGTFIISFGAGFITALLVRYLVVPWQRKRITRQCTILPENRPEFNISGSDNNVALSANSSLNQSHNNSAEASPSLSQENIPLQITPPPPPPPPHEIKENHKNAANNFLMPPINVTTGILKEIDQNAPPLEKKSSLKQPSKGKINKAEDASLLDNEYKSGNLTPIKSPTVEDFSKKENGFMNGFENGEEVKTVSADSSLSQNSLDANINGLGVLERGRQSITDRPETAKVFSFLQILTAIFGAFAHGGNDVSNAIGPLVSLWLTASQHEVLQKAPIPIWILFYGGAGISIGLWVMGRRVIKTMGEDLAKITPSSGFCIEIGSALTVLVASNCKIPISTTHCKVGSVVFVGRFRSRENVDWSIFRNIVFAWLVTLPISGGISAAIMAGLMKIVS